MQCFSEQGNVLVSDATLASPWHRSERTQAAPSGTANVPLRHTEAATGCGGSRHKSRYTTDGVAPRRGPTCVLWGNGAAGSQPSTNAEASRCRVGDLPETSRTDTKPDMPRPREAIRFVTIRREAITAGGAVGIERVADLPGVRKDGLAVKVDGAQPTIEGSAQIDVPQNLEPLYGEIRSRHFRRSFTLSPELDPSRIEARLSNGVLRMHIPKSEAARPRRIEIRAQ